MSERKRGLGRGLEALLGQAAPRVESGPATGSDALARIPVGQLERGRYQPRLDLREESLAELANSIRAQGLMQPILVRPLGTPAPGTAPRYEIIAGERRWRAAQQAGLTEVPAIVRDVDDEAAVAMALIENIQRENLNPLEEARALERLTSEFGLTHQEAAEAVGRSRATVSNLLRLLELPEEVRSLVEQRQIEMGHARALLALEHKRQQTEVGALVAKKGLSVRETEALVRRLLARGEPGAGSAPTRETDPDIRRLQNDLADRLGAQVELHHAASGRGRLVIRYHSLDELDGILARIR